MKPIDKIKKELYPSNDYIFKNIIVDDEEINIIFNEVLTSTNNINEYILFRLTKLNKKELKNLNNYIPCGNSKIINDKSIIYYLNMGYAIVIVNNTIYAFELKNNLDRGISKCDSELSIGGPKDSFSELFNNNLGLIRKRIRNSHLKCKNINIGNYTKTKVGILYIDNICDHKLVNNIISKLKKINIDGIIDSSYLKNSLEEKSNLFPTIMMSERPDKCSMALLEGKAVIIVDNSPYALILPSFFIDFFHTTDDYFQKSFNTTFIRIIRLIAFLTAIFLPGIYIAVTTRNYNLVPYQLLLVLKAGRSFVPFPAYIETLLMIISFEILKESDVRMSTTTSTSVSILGGLILGDAAVAAGIVSPIIIIITALSSISELTFNSIELVNTIRFYKILILISSTILGIYGVLIGFIFMLYNMYFTRIFNYNYLTIDKNEIKDSFIKMDSNIKYRNSKLTKNTIRGWFK
ncbi:MAG: spore germination protein [Bacilli bacterium]